MFFFIFVGCEFVDAKFSAKKSWVILIAFCFLTPIGILVGFWAQQEFSKLGSAVLTGLSMYYHPLWTLMRVSGCFFTLRLNGNTIQGVIGNDRKKKIIELSPRQLHTQQMYQSDSMYSKIPTKIVHANY
jgi:hypothetical protein